MYFEHSLQNTSLLFVFVLVSLIIYTSLVTDSVNKRPWSTHLKPAVTTIKDLKDHIRPLSASHLFFSSPIALCNHFQFVHTVVYTPELLSSYIHSFSFVFHSHKKKQKKYTKMWTQISIQLQLIKEKYQSVKGDNLLVLSSHKKRSTIDF